MAEVLEEIVYGTSCAELMQGLMIERNFLWNLKFSEPLTRERVLYLLMLGEALYG